MPDGFGPWLALLVGAAATYLWRGLGVALSGWVSPQDRAFEWVGCVAYALLAGLIARMILLPVGPLAATPLSARLAAAGVAGAVFLLPRRPLLPALVAGSGVLAAWMW